MAAQGEEEVARYLARAARRENLILYALLGMLLCLFVIVALLLTPALA
jgi:type II secretory pathway component PulM